MHGPVLFQVRNKCLGTACGMKSTHLSFLKKRFFSRSHSTIIAATDKKIAFTLMNVCFYLSIVRGTQ